jgi:hypothetical protein
MLKENDIAGVDITDHTGNPLVTVSRDMRGPFASVEKKVYLTETEESAAWVSRLAGTRDAHLIGRGEGDLFGQGDQRSVQPDERTLFVYSAGVERFGRCHFLCCFPIPGGAPGFSGGDSQKSIIR